MNKPTITQPTITQDMINDVLADTRMSVTDEMLKRFDEWARQSQ